jgi:hypothetical protein
VVGDFVRVRGECCLCMVWNVSRFLYALVELERGLKGYLYGPCGKLS